MLTAAAEAGVVELSRLAVTLACSSHISSEQLGGRFSRCGVRAAEKISEVGFLYGVSAAPPVPHQNHKPVFAEMSDLAKISKIQPSSNFV